MCVFWWSLPKDQTRSINQKKNCFHSPIVPVSGDSWFKRKALLKRHRLLSCDEIWSSRTCVCVRMDPSNKKHFHYVLRLCLPPCSTCVQSGNAHTRLSSFSWLSNCVFRLSNTSTFGCCNHFLLVSMGFSPLPSCLPVLSFCFDRFALFNSLPSFLPPPLYPLFTDTHERVFFLIWQRRSAFEINERPFAAFSSSVHLFLISGFNFSITSSGQARPLATVLACQSWVGHFTSFLIFWSDQWCCCWWCCRSC